MGNLTISFHFSKTQATITVKEQRTDYFVLIKLLLHE